MRKILAVLLSLISSVALAQNVNGGGGGGGGGGGVSVGPFLSGGVYGTNLTVGNASTVQSLPAGTSVHITNQGPSTVSCDFATSGSPASATRSHLLLYPLGERYRLVGTFNQLTCINQLSGDTTSNTVTVEGGSGLGTDIPGVGCFQPGSAPTFNNGAIAGCQIASSGAMQTNDAQTQAVLASMTITLSGTFTDKSGTIAVGGTSQQLAASNANRKRLIVFNPCDASSQNVATAESIDINWTSAASHTAGGSITLQPCATFDSGTSGLSTEQVNVVGATNPHKYTAKEM